MKVKRVFLNDESFDKIISEIVQNELEESIEKIYNHQQTDMATHKNNERWVA